MLRLLLISLIALFAFGGVAEAKGFGGGFSGGRSSSPAPAPAPRPSSPPPAPSRPAPVSRPAPSRPGSRPNIRPRVRPGTRRPIRRPFRPRGRRIAPPGVYGPHPVAVVPASQYQQCQKKKSGVSGVVVFFLALLAVAVGLFCGYILGRA